MTVKMIVLDENIYIYLFIAMSALIVGLCIAVIITKWLKNKRFPVITVKAKISDLNICKYNRYRNRYASPGRESSTVNLYYAVFGTENGEHIELRVKKLEYYKLKKGYKGKLTFQGTKYISFERL